MRHVAGRRNVDECRTRLDALRKPGDALDYQLVAYEEHMERLYADASVLVCRAGAVTVAELAATGTPAVLVPLPGAPDDHQTRNARALVEVDAGVLIPDGELDGSRLDAELTALWSDPARLEHMSRGGADDRTCRRRRARRRPRRGGRRCRGLTPCRTHWIWPRPRRSTSSAPAARG